MTYNVSFMSDVSFISDISHLVYHYCHYHRHYHNLFHNHYHHHDYHRHYHYHSNHHHFCPSVFSSTGAMSISYAEISEAANVHNLLTVSGRTVNGFAFSDILFSFLEDATIKGDFHSSDEVYLVPLPFKMFLDRFHPFHCFQLFFFYFCLFSNRCFSLFFKVFFVFIVLPVFTVLQCRIDFSNNKKISEIT